MPDAVNYKAWYIFCASLYASITAVDSVCTVCCFEINTKQIPKAYLYYFVIVLSFTEIAFRG